MSLSLIQTILNTSGERGSRRGGGISSWFTQTKTTKFVLKCPEVASCHTASSEQETVFLTCVPFFSRRT